MNLFQKLFSPDSAERRKYLREREAYVKSVLGPAPSPGVYGSGEYAGDMISPPDPGYYDYMQKLKEVEQQWFNQLPPDKQQQVGKTFQEYSGALDSVNKYGKIAALSTIGAVAGGAGLTAAGLLGGGASGTTAAGSSVLGDLAGIEAGLGYGGYGGAGGTVASQSGLLGGTALASGASPLGSAGVDLAGLASTGGSGVSGVSKLLPGSGGNMSGLLGGSVGDWASLLSAGAGVANSLKSPALPGTPDYLKLAQEQARLNQEAADKQLAANRPNQIDAAGNSLTWTQDPVTGKWTSTEKLSDANQQLLNTGQGAQLAALRGVAGQGDFNFQGDPLMDPTGNASEIQDAWMNLLKPERQMQRDGEIQRLKNQGLTEDSPAFQRAMLRLDQADTDAQNKALIYGTSEYGNRFNRSLQGRQQSFGEYQTDYGMPMQQYQGLMGIAAPRGQFGNFTNAQNPGGANVYGAGQDQYAASTANANVKNAQNNNLTQGLFGLAGNIAKGGWGGP